MNKKHVLAAVGGSALVFALGTGLSAAQTSPSPPPTARHDVTHEQMQAQMPDVMTAQCDKAHAGMGTGNTGTTSEGGMAAGSMMNSMSSPSSN